MAKTDNLFLARKSLDEICTVPEKIISVYSLEKHVWVDSNSMAARKGRKPELKTVEEFQLDPVRPFLTDIFRNMAAPYKPERKENPIGQGYWIQAEFGSGKSHLLCLLAALGLGRKEAWDIIAEKEQKAGRGKRESLYRFWEEGIEAKSGKGKKGIFVVVRTLVGAGGGTVGLTDKGQRLSEYILDSAKDQLQTELGKNLSLYPVELLADRFLSEDVDRYRPDLRKFLRDPRFFTDEQFEDVDGFIKDIQQNKSPEYKRSCGNKLWSFYTDYLKVQPQIAAESEDILKNMVEVIVAEGYSGVLLVLDEVSLFMKNRDDNQRADDEKTLVVLSNRLAKVHNLPIWTVCAAQQAIETKMGVKNIIADDRLKLVKLLEEDKDYYDIVLARVREIKAPGAVSNYYLHYKKGFTWPNSIGEKEFSHFFPFHKPAIEVLRAITYELTTTRSAIHFMHQTLKHQISNKGRELIRLWELFDETVRYEEDPSGVHAGLVAIKTKKESEYKAYEVCKRQIDDLTKGPLKVYRDKAIKIIQTLFLYHVAKTRQMGLTPEEIANSVLIERDAECTPDENIQHYENLSENLKKELRQIAQSLDEDKRPRYRFDPIFTKIDPRDEFRKARDEAESNEKLVQEAWDHLLALDEWPVRTRQMTLDLSNGVKSIFREVAPFVGPWEDKTAIRRGDQHLELAWQNRQIAGLVGMRDLGRIVSDNLPLPAVDSDQTDLDFAVFVGTKPVQHEAVAKLIARRKDPRVAFWVPASLSAEDRGKLLDFAAYRKLIADWQGKETEDAVAIISWVANSMQTDLGSVAKIVDGSYARGRIDAVNNSELKFHVAGELTSVLSPVVDRLLNTAYESRDIKFEPPFIFRKEEGVKVINGIVKTGKIPKGVKPNQNISAAQNFGFGLNIMKKSAEKELDPSDNRYVKDIWSFIESKLTDHDQAMKVETLYKNFMGIGGPKDYGLTRRMVDIFLLCLVQQGKIRVGAGPKSGLATSFIDYSNLAQIDFTTKTLESFTDVQKLAKPENWEVLRPYAEKLLEEEIPSIHDDAEISASRAKLRELFTREKGASPRIVERAASLFETLKHSNPYEAEVTQVVKLFTKDLQAGNDINDLLYSLKDVFAYQAFDTGTALQAEVDDFANRLRNYRDLERFLGFEPELRAAQAYSTHPLPDLPELKEVRKAQQKTSDKLASIKTYIDSEVKLKTELIGKTRPDVAEHGTLGALIRDYTIVYLALHDSTTDLLDKARNAIRAILEGKEFKALRMLEKINALKPESFPGLAKTIDELESALFKCAVPSRASIEEQLKTGPVHECGLSFDNASGYVTSADAAVQKASYLFDWVFNRKMEIFLSPKVRERLEQGHSEPVIAGLLKCTSGSEVRRFLVKACLADAGISDTINHYLKRIKVKRVKIGDFRPSVGTVEKDQLASLGNEFQKFLEDAINSIEGDDDTLPMLQLD